MWGDGEFRAFETNPAFEWKRGGTITIQIWDDRVDKKGRLIGSKTWGGAYALPLACLRMQPIDVKSGNFADDKGLEGLSVKLIVAGFEDLPDLPEYRALTPAPAGKPAAR